MRFIGVSMLNMTFFLHESLKKLVQEMDFDGNGKIDFDEFVVFSDKAANTQK